SDLLHDDSLNGCPTKSSPGCLGDGLETMKKFALTFLIFALAASAVLAQRRGRGGGYRDGWYGGESWISEDAQTAREVPTHSTGTPTWTNAPGFEKDVWTFVRIKRGRSYYSSGGSWAAGAPGGGHH